MFPFIPKPLEKLPELHEDRVLGLLCSALYPQLLPEYPALPKCSLILIVEWSGMFSNGNRESGHLLW